MLAYNVAWQLCWQLVSCRSRLASLSLWDTFGRLNDYIVAKMSFFLLRLTSDSDDVFAVANSHFIQKRFVMQFLLLFKPLNIKYRVKLSPVIRTSVNVSKWSVLREWWGHSVGKANSELESYAVGYGWSLWYKYLDDIDKCQYHADLSKIVITKAARKWKIAHIHSPLCESIYMKCMNRKCF